MAIKADQEVTNCLYMFVFYRTCTVIRSGKCKIIQLDRRCLVSLNMAQIMNKLSGIVEGYTFHKTHTNMTCVKRDMAESWWAFFSRQHWNHGGKQGNSIYLFAFTLTMRHLYIIHNLKRIGVSNIKMCYIFVFYSSDVWAWEWRSKQVLWADRGQTKNR